MKSRSVIGAAALAAAFAVAGQSALAAERGKFVGHAVLMATKYNEYKTADGHPYKAAQSGEVEGLLFHNGGGSRLDRMLAHAATARAIYEPSGNSRFLTS